MHEIYVGKNWAILKYNIEIHVIICVIITSRYKFLHVQLSHSFYVVYDGIMMHCTIFSYSETKKRVNLITAQFRNKFNIRKGVSCFWNLILFFLLTDSILSKKFLVIVQLNLMCVDLSAMLPKFFEISLL